MDFYFLSSSKKRVELGGNKKHPVVMECRVLRCDKDVYNIEGLEIYKLAIVIYALMMGS